MCLINTLNESLLLLTKILSIVHENLKAWAYTFTLMKTDANKLVKRSQSCKIYATFKPATL